MPREITASWRSALLSLPVSPVARRLWNTCSMSQQSVLSIHSPNKRLWGYFQCWDGILFAFQSLYPNICCPRPALRVWILTYAELTPIFFSFYSLLNGKHQFLFIDFNMNMSPKILATMSWKFKCLLNFKCRNLPRCMRSWTFICLWVCPKQPLALLPNK